MKKAETSRKKRAYHHGDLADQLVAAAEAIILERGVDGFTLREAARRAGVSPAAPAHHFKDARGLLSEVALRGFRDFGDALAAGDARGGADPQARLREQGLAYVHFALANPARFQLMFAHGKCDMGHKDLASTANRSFLVLEDAVRAAYKLSQSEALTPDAHGFLLATWSVVHGFAHLALGGDLGPSGVPGGKDGIVKTLLPLMLQHLPAPLKK